MEAETMSSDLTGGIVAYIQPVCPIYKKFTDDKRVRVANAPNNTQVTHPTKNSRTFP